MRHIYVVLMLSLFGCKKKIEEEKFKFMSGIICKGFIQVSDQSAILARAYPMHLSSSTFVIEEIRIRDLNEKEKEFLK